MFFKDAGILENKMQLDWEQLVFQAVGRILNRAETCARRYESRRSCSRVQDPRPQDARPRQDVFPRRDELQVACLDILKALNDILF